MLSPTSEGVGLAGLGKDMWLVMLQAEDVPFPCTHAGVTCATNSSQVSDILQDLSL